MKSTNPKDILDGIRNCPYLKVHNYGRICIGSVTWDWFSLENGMSNLAQKANLVEWFLRIANEPTSAKAIAEGIRDKVGYYELSAYDVANVCEENTHRFKFGEDMRYSLYLWEDAPKYKEPLKEILNSEPLDVEYIVRHLSNEQLNDGEIIIAALHFYKDIFAEIAPFKWKLKETEDIGIDYTKLGFDELIPE